MRFYPESLLLLSLTSGVASFSFHGHHHGGVNTRSTAMPVRTKLNIASIENTPGSSNGSSTSSANASKAMAPDMEAYAAGYSTVFAELPFQSCNPSHGTLPADLIGSYFRSGPAMFSAGAIVPPIKSIVQPKQPPVPDGQEEDRMVKHPFDGDGAILGVTFSGDGTASARFRYVRTASMTKERKKGQKLYNGMEATRLEGASVANGQGNDFPVPLFKHHLAPGLNKSRKNTSNTRCVYWSKKLLTLWEGGLPYKLDALGLSTEGRSQLGGVLRESDPFSGAAVYCSKKDRMLFYSNKQDSGSSELTLWEFNSKFRVAHSKEYKLPGFALISDFTATEKYALFVQPPVSTNGMSFMLNKDPSKSLKIDKASALLHVIKRGSDSMKTISIPVDNLSDADLQFVNAYESEDGSIIFDAIRSDSSKVSKTMKEWPWAKSMDDFAASASKKSLWRYTVNVSGDGSVAKECITDVPTYYGSVNPSVSGQAYQYAYAAVGAMGNENAPPQGIGKINVVSKTLEAWYPEEYEFCGEPMFAPKKSSESSTSSPNEDDGYIISVLLNGKEKKSEIIILDATNIEAGPVTRIPLGVTIPHGLHGCFAASDECAWSGEEIERRAKLADKMESRANMWNEVKSDFSGLGLRLDDFEEIFGDIL
jgi:all-trans-8'-apo-beta-carotenal 15,15'-oxygenase